MNLPKLEYNFIQHGNQTTSSLNIERTLRGIIKYLKERDTTPDHYNDCNNPKCKGCTATGYLKLSQEPPKEKECTCESIGKTLAYLNDTCPIHTPKPELNVEEKVKTLVLAYCREWLDNKFVLNEKMEDIIKQLANLR